eukprot:CAMPEP_0172577808 /NCGR_PEP_ID=MMETSP1067-20121228/138420_1 /TAXON_ID=265564 ORGANISM="Thalassiosira punctigera, Strain Tpunct2005C2" /NCGR_SAMPLE_ID=MMETSP1067 /ASSEMBLY_ACC=CAM_ASM_000444 /LENGTH=143 /DNA_ID=CAMNT_0013370499 /DNA_START=672 /DNA_END=1101 /DNA_ORIENTATION=+
MSKTQQPETIIEENKAATAIQTCFRGYRDFVRFIMKLFSAIQIQTAVRGYQTRCYLQRLKQEEERMSLQNAAATAIQSCFRGYQDFSTLIIMQHFVCEIQARGEVTKYDAVSENSNEGKGNVENDGSRSKTVDLKRRARSFGR